MKVYVLSYVEFAGLINSLKNNEQDISKYLFISILDSDGYFSQPILTEQADNMLTLIFDDVTKSGEPSPTNSSGNTIAFSDNHANLLREFLEKNKDKHQLFVHCAAGISRSGAVGTYVNDRYGDDDFETFMRRNSRIVPNPMIMRIMNSDRYEN